jgi:membrane-bound ClpP family serine protease
MSQHGWGLSFAHHGWLRVAGALGGLALLFVAVLIFTNAISLLLAAAIFAGVSMSGAGLAWNVMRIARFAPPAPPHQRLLDAPAKVIVALAPEGRVLVQGENWAAVLDDAFSDQAIPVGNRVRVIGVEDLRLIVTPSIDDILTHVHERPSLDTPSHVVP